MITASGVERSDGRSGRIIEKTPGAGLEKSVPHHRCAIPENKEVTDTTRAFLDAEVPHSPLANDMIPQFRLRGACRSGGEGAGGHAARSMSPAAPMPPPTHI
ncbi:MAG TPA: hypothetical protein VN903_08115, partial [Polyangia bacterium]|nr:hypothetical protein [Polyangia bacterium]